MYIGIPQLAYIAYEYSDGFIEFHQWKHHVVHVLRWDTVQGVEANHSRYGTTYSIRASSNPQPNNYITIPYRRIWKRCKQAAIENEAKSSKIS